MDNIALNFELNFTGIVLKTKLQYGQDIDKIRELILLYSDFEQSLKEFRETETNRCEDSLVAMSYVESARISIHILFLTLNALYKNAYDDIRYIIESIIQSSYLDNGHPDSDLKTKMEIWKEIEDKREYHSQTLIDKLELGEQRQHKTKLGLEYKKLSQKIHFGHKQMKCTIVDLGLPADQVVPAKIDPNEITSIFHSLCSAYDIIFLLYIVRFPEIKALLIKNGRFQKDIKKFDLPILNKVFDNFRP